MAEWVARNYTKGEIDKAGGILRAWWSGIPQRTTKDMTNEEREQIWWAWGVAENWRSSHAMPLLSFRMGLTHRARKGQRDALIAQRMKRMNSILAKLSRESNMQLSQMQDLGGCRAILSSVENADRILDMYYGGIDDLFESEGTLRRYDYVRNPKPDGYRGIHVVGRYQARIEKNQPWNGHRIEIQLRSRLQHAFATAVETVTTFTRYPLKFRGGPQEWQRFFALVGSAFAMREGTEPVPGTPTDPVELVSELKDATKNLKVRQRLAGWTRALRQLPKRNVKQFQWLLLVLNVSKNTIQVTGFSSRNEAARVLAEIEKQEGPGNIDAVLVWVRSVRDLKAAYPNYYADTGGFIEALNEALRA